jgi:hypothetical protein
METLAPVETTEDKNAEEAAQPYEPAPTEPSFPAPTLPSIEVEREG